MRKNRIAIFQSRHTLQIHTAFLASLLQEAGYDVEVFLCSCSTRIFGTKGIGTRVYDLTPFANSWKETRGTVRRWAAALEEFVFGPAFASDQRFVGERVVEETLRILGTKPYHCLVGIEKMGLVWAGLVARKIHVPVLYQSYELYFGKYIFSVSPLKWIRFLRTRRVEKRFHRTTFATIIQDDSRSNKLKRANHYPAMKSLLVPIGLRGQSVARRTEFLQKKFPQLIGKTVILQFGLIEPRRFSADLIRLAQEFPPEWALVLHGRFEGKTTLETLMRIDKGGKVVFSNEPVDTGDLDDLISSATVGLCFYSKKTVNESTAGFSSEKLARYFKCGVPVVAFDYPSFRASVHKTGGGVCIRDLSQLSSGIEAIQANYETYRSNAHKAYKDYFCLDTSFKEVVRSIDAIV